MWGRIHLIPLLQAEEDRDLVRRTWADKARERELLGKETKVYHSDRWVLVSFCCPFPYSLGEVIEKRGTYLGYIRMDWIGDFVRNVDRLTVLALQIRPSYVLHHPGESYEVDAITVDLVDGIMAFHSSVMVHAFQINRLCEDHGYRFIWPNPRCAMRDVSTPTLLCCVRSAVNSISLCHLTQTLQQFLQDPGSLPFYRLPGHRPSCISLVKPISISLRRAWEVCPVRYWQRR